MTNGRVFGFTCNDWRSFLIFLLDESCARYSRLQCGIGVSPLLPPPFTYGEGVLLGQQLRALCLETELEKWKKQKARLSVSVPLLRGTG